MEFNRKELEPVLNEYFKSQSKNNYNRARKINQEMYESAFRKYESLIANGEKLKKDLEMVVAKYPHRVKEAESDFNELIKENKAITDQASQFLNRLLDDQMVIIRIQRSSQK